MSQFNTPTLIKIVAETKTKIKSLLRKNYPILLFVLNQQHYLLNLSLKNKHWPKTTYGDRVL